MQDVFLPLYKLFYEYMGRWHHHLKSEHSDPMAAMRRMMELAATQSQSQSPQGGTSESRREPSILDNGTYIPEMQAVATLSGVKAVNSMISKQSLWLPPNPLSSDSESGENTVDGRKLERQTLLGRMIGLGPHRGCYRSPALATIATGTQGNAALPGTASGGQQRGTDDLIKRIADTTYPDGGMSSMPDDMLQARCMLGVDQTRETISPEERKAGKELIKTIKSSIHTHAASVQPVVDGYLRKGARKEVMNWLATVLQRNRMRASVGFLHHGKVSNAGKLSSHAFLVQLGKVMINVCSPFMDPTSNLASKIDIRFIIDAPGCGNDLFPTQKETKMCSFDVKSLLKQHTDGSAGSTSNSANRWLDSRNHARIKQFESQQKAAAQEQIANLKAIVAAQQNNDDLTGSLPSSSAGKASNEALRKTMMGLDLPENLTRSDYGTVSQFFFSTMVTLHLGVLATMQRHQNILRSLKHTKDQRKTIQQQAQRGNQRAQMGLLQAAQVIERDTEELLTIESFIYDTELISSCINFYRSVAVLMMRTLMRPLDIVAAANGEVEQPLVPLLNETSGSNADRSKAPLPMVSLKLPLPLPTQHITCIPEFMVEDGKFPWIAATYRSV